MNLIKIKKEMLNNNFGFSKKGEGEDLLWVATANINGKLITYIENNLSLIHLHKSGDEGATCQIYLNLVESWKK